MKEDESSHTGIVGVASKGAGLLVGTAAAFGKRFAGAGVEGVTAVGSMLTRRAKQPAAVRASRGVKPVAETAAPVTETTSALAAERESDLSEVRRELVEVEASAHETEERLGLELDVLREEKQSLISELEGARRETDEVTTREESMQARLAKLESDLAAARDELVKPPSDDEPSEPESPSGDVEDDATGEPVDLPSEAAVASTEPADSEETDQMAATSPADEDDMPVAAPGVSTADVRSAAFADPTERITFGSFLSDLASKHAATRVDAVRAMAGVRHELSVKALVAQLARDESSQVRQECVKALTALGMAEGLPGIRRATTDRAASVRLAAMWGIYRLAGAESASVLSDMLSDESEQVRRRSATCIGWLGRADLAPRLTPLLAEDSVSVRRAAVEAMSSLRSVQVAPALVEALNDPDPSLRKTALKALRTITGKRMNGPSPQDDKSFRRLVARWRHWCKAANLQ